MVEDPAADSLAESERLDVAADQAIALAGGDMRSAIRSLILANEYLEAEFAELVRAVSKGYARGRTRKPNVASTRTADHANRADAKAE